MKITILKIIEPTALGANVEFSTSFGVGLSYFVGSNLEENQYHDVEISIDDDFVWGENIMPSNKTTPSIAFRARKLYITAQLISGEDEDCTALKIENSITLISLDKSGPPSMFVDIIAQKTSLYPTNI